MSTGQEVITQDDAELVNKIKAMAGQFVGGSNNYIPVLFVTREDEDDQGNEVELGAIGVKLMDDEYKDEQGRPRVAYAKKKASVTFRPYTHRYRYEYYDSKTKTGARSVMLPNFTDGEFMSDNGRIKCGRNAEGEFQGNKVRCSHYFHGTVSFDGKFTDGTKVEVKDAPCIVKVSGKPWMEVEKVYKAMDKEGRLLPAQVMTITPFHIKGGGGYTKTIEFGDRRDELPVTQETLDTLKKFTDYINTENKAIVNKYNQKINESNYQAEEQPFDTDVEIIEPDGDLQSDLVDED